MCQKINSNAPGNDNLPSKASHATAQSNAKGAQEGKAKRLAWVMLGSKVALIATPSQRLGGWLELEQGPADVRDEEATGAGCVNIRLLFHWIAPDEA